MLSTWGNMTGGAGKVCQVESEFVQKLIEAGVHFGHRVSRWNPKMAPYIYGRKNLIHIMDIRENSARIAASEKVSQPSRYQWFIGLVCGYQATSFGDHPRASFALRDAVCLGALAGRGTDQLPHDP